MTINLYEVNQNTGEETFIRACYLADAIPDPDERYPVAMELRDSGRAWIGGGAAPLFLAKATNV